MRVGIGELILFLLVVLFLIYGAKRLPEFARALGQSLSAFKKGKEEGYKPEEEPKTKEPTEKS